MIRTLLALCGLAVVAVAAAWLAERPGTVVIAWPGYRIDTTAAFAVVAALLLMAASAAFYRVWRWLLGGPARFGAARDADRRRRGYLALTQGLTAAAAGDGVRAGRLARRAEALLDEPRLTLLLQAQSAQLSDSEGAAAQHFAAMLAFPETELLGLRGLVARARQTGDGNAALGYARRAHRLRPATPWALSALFDLEAAAGNWEAAEEILEPSVKAGGLEPRAAKRRKALARLGRAHAAEHVGATGEALRHAAAAHALAPALVPAAAVLGRLALARGQPRKAAAAVLATWPRAPHPDLAQLYRALDAQHAPEARLARVEKLVSGNPAHKESRIAVAEAAIEARAWATARRQLEAVADVDAEARVCRLMATLEETEHGDGPAAQVWRDRAARAAPDAAWSCGVCAGMAQQWRAHCPACGAFDSLAWDAAVAPPRALGSAAPTPLALSEHAAVSEPADALPPAQGLSVSVPSRIRNPASARENSCRAGNGPAPLG